VTLYGYLLTRFHNFSAKRLKAKQQCSYVLQSTPKSQPTGVTIIAILNIIGGVIMLFGAITLIAIGAILPTLPQTTFNQSGLQGNLTAGQVPVPPPSVPPMVSQSLLGGIGIASGIVLLAIAIVSFVVAYGLLKGLGWAWTVTVILSIASIVFNAISIATGNIAAIISILISGIIIYYLYRPHVKAYFGKGVSPSTPAA
jgi:hypothetical protein